jgi:hypothetical protein
MDLEREEFVTICDSRVDSFPQFLEEAVNVKVEVPKVARQHDDTKKIDEWISQLLFAQLIHLGAIPEKGVLGEKSTLRKKAAIIDKYNSWWQESLTILETRGYLQLEADQVMVANDGAFDQETVWEEWESARQSFFENFEHSFVGFM